METTQMNYGYRISTSLEFDQAVDQVTEALQSEGFGVLTEIDVQATLKKKLDVDFRRYVILGACNPPLAYQALNAEIDVGLLLPCNVVVYEHESGSVVGMLNAISRLGVAENPELDSIANDANERLQRVIEQLQNG
jgi:uncharacterized protein (DUF302 family)